MNKILIGSKYINLRNSRKLKFFREKQSLSILITKTTCYMPNGVLDNF